MAKKNKVQKVSKESGIDEADLNRLPVDALEKLDDMTPDADIDIYAEENSQELPTDSGSEEGGGDDAQGESDMDSSGHTGGNDGRLEPEISGAKKPVGHHPITKEPVYL